MNYRKKEQILIPRDRHSSDMSTIFISDHDLFPTQLKVIEKMHGHDKRQIENITSTHLPNRYVSFQDWIEVVMNYVHDPSVSGIYIVIHREWKTRFIKEYIEPGKVNGALIGWFTGFGEKEYLSHVKQKMTYIWHGCVLDFDIEKNFGRTPVIKKHRKKKDSISELKITRPNKTQQRRKK
ncbi:MAG: hypothetical protein ACI870_000040 [Crocinitomicaceae bacterium]|jgi:hypothetical protein